MTYAVSFALQSAIYDRLINDAGVAAVVGSAVFDAPPSGVAPAAYVLIGDEIANDNSDKSGGAARHDLDVAVISDAAGFATAKQIAGAVCDALIDADLTLSRGSLIGLHFRSARALRSDNPGQRQIDLRFRAFVADA